MPFEELLGWASIRHKSRIPVSRLAADILTHIREPHRQQVGVARAMLRVVVQHEIRERKEAVQTQVPVCELFGKIHLCPFQTSGAPPRMIAARVIVTP